MFARERAYDCKLVCLDVNVVSCGLSSCKILLLSLKKLQRDMQEPVLSILVEVERIRGQAQDRLMNKLAAARHKAEEKRATAEAKSNRQAAKTDKQADYIRRTGRVPSSFTFCGWCWCW
ncbi:hypothetical protein POTOM_031851 [Populus tomentosa]|uniref:Remorin C-terminal domain-containing protein n=1 Tax=Populus tomentosa TaxID=118781 RepID=A0A8X7Z4X2_POPTO|nr:hypothetical protein POTOM_031851 [Populus tomentosa]